MDAFHEGRLARVEMTDRVHSAVVNVYDPTAFQYGRELRSGHSADRVLVWTEEPPYNWESDEHKYEVGAVERNLFSVFGGSIEWIPLTERALRILSESGYRQNATRDHVQPNTLTMPETLAEEAPLALTGSNAGASGPGEES
jgi:hypothetical protein